MDGNITSEEIESDMTESNTTENDLSSNLSELVDAEIDVEANDFGDDPSKGSSTSAKRKVCSSKKAKIGITPGDTPQRQ